MEKVIVVETTYSLNQKNVKEVNELLEKGWKVKFVTMAATDNYMSAIFVLSKE